MSETQTHQAGCFCCAVRLELSGDAFAMGYCHCESCRHWSAGPVNAFTLWKPEQVKVTTGTDQLASYNKTPGSTRKWCKTCGGHVMTEHPTMGATDVYAAVIEDFDFRPGVHVHYQETVLRIHDGLAKFKDFPADFGGSGEQIDE